MEQWSVSGAPTYDIGQRVSAKGLPQISVKTIVRDSQNFIWIGTENGLARFDGRNFEFFNTVNTPELGSNWIEGLFLDDIGDVWIATRIGLVRYSNGEFSAIASDLNGEPVQLIVSSKKDRAWAITTSLWKIQKNTLQKTKAIAEQIYHPVYHNRHLWFIDEANNLLQASVGASIDIDCRYQLGLKTPVDGLIVKQNAAFILSKTSLHRYEVSSANCGIEKIERLDDLEIASIHNSHSDGIVAVTNKGALFDVDTSGSGVRKALTDYLDKAALMDDGVLFDDNGTWFLGSKTKGLHLYWPTSVKRVGQSQDISQSRVWSFFATEGNLYAATDSGVFVTNDGEQWRLLISADELEGNSAYSFFTDSNDYWVGTRNGLYIRSTEDAFSRSDVQLEGLQINTLYADENVVYVATTKGLFSFDGMDVSSIPTFESQSVRSILKTKNEVLWVGTEAGLFKKENGVWAEVDVLNSGNIFVSSLLEYGDGQLLVATYGKGLFLLDNNSWQAFNVKNGLPFQDLFAIQIRDNKLWLSGASGIASIPLSELGNKQLTSDVILRDDGTFSARSDLRCCNGAGNHRTIVFKDKLYLPTLEGVLSVGDTIAPMHNGQTTITGVYVEGVRLNQKYEKLNLGRKQNAEVDFSVATFSSETIPEYRYRLDSSDWVYAGHREEAFLAKLPAGETRFEVSSKINGAGWSTPDSVIFYVEPHWWESSLAKALGLLATVAMLYALYLHRIARFRRRNELLEARVKERTLAFERVNSELKIKNKALEEAALTDPLTGLYNRRAVNSFLPNLLSIVNERAEQHAHTNENSETCAIFLIDLDNFKQLNDTFGHDKGDAVLYNVSKALQLVCRSSDKLVRWGGEEFLLVVPSINKGDISKFNKRLHESIENLHIALELPTSITMSIGVTTLPWDDSAVDARLWEHAVLIADWALYQVKNNGRDGTSLVTASQEMVLWPDWGVEGLSTAKERGLLQLTLLGGNSRF
ncbi:diguanylate cyclase [Alteromonas marina]|uniref:ligand-binding sensor domain-containing diguanylate cyclase n=1 Tax=Alteromonas sp. KUL150 TaxID=2480805 RepID=UPI00132F5631|nr:diguanylate cyclase [Alteromonas sp. KUL150]